MIQEFRAWLHDVMPVLVAVMVLLLLASLAYAKHAADTADTNTISIATLQQDYLEQQAEGKVFQVFLKGFDAEANYECSVLWYLNEHDPSLPYHPPMSICEVTAP